MMNKKEYFDSVLNFIDNLSDEEFDALLIESGIEKCPYEDFKQKYESKPYHHDIKATSSLSIPSLENLNLFSMEGDAA
ncbi:hypothetical protein KQI42_07135 [Tissierella sp. MSJ-40]|uniref:Nif11 domain-containing protein n=1 Tax=Tissierella simiarum TaxID=2841534 RepID=A0ABS6E4D6_9FIRM|nr:hypothetical protein [Tissierella simiarum]MBU5437775.1 hypothetical protein [Tissierella simiarum]